MRCGHVAGLHVCQASPDSHRVVLKRETPSELLVRMKMFLDKLDLEEGKMAITKNPGLHVTARSRTSGRRRTQTTGASGR